VPNAARCPACGGVLTIHTDGAVGVLVWNGRLGTTRTVWERRPFASCGACEFCVDLSDAITDLRKEQRTWRA
jgi:hypothetical protein